MSDPPVRDVVMKCLHVNRWKTPAPSKGEVAYCRKCGGFRVVIEQPDSYRTRCVPPPGSDCGYHGRSYGVDAGAARLAAWRHVQRYPSHQVDVTRNGEVVTSVTFSDPLLPGMEEHRNNLREFVTRSRKQGLDKTTGT